jgi:hypothetical protein
MNLTTLDLIVIALPVSLLLAHVVASLMTAIVEFLMEWWL